MKNTKVGLLIITVILFTHVYIPCRCGSGLGELFQSPFVQQSLNGSTTACSHAYSQLYLLRSFVRTMQVERNKPQSMFFGSVTLRSPFSQTTHTVIEAISRQLFTLQSSEVESPRYDDKVSSFGAVRISNGVIGNCFKCTVDGEVGYICSVFFIQCHYTLQMWQWSWRIVSVSICTTIPKW